jgi:hypothetical protein
MDLRILAIDIGGATTDVFTAVRGQVQRTVSANLGMSYSILNVVQSAGMGAVREALDVELPEVELWDRIGEKYVQPTRLAPSVLDVKVEWAAAAAAIREAVKDHLRVLEGISISRDEADLKIRHAFDSVTKKKQAEAKVFALSGYDLVIGSGGILSHSSREAAAMMLINALRPAEPVQLAVDSAFMFPHLGVLSEVCPELAVQLFTELGLVRLGPVLRAQGTGRPGSPAMRVQGNAGEARAIDVSVSYGEMRTIPLGENEDASLACTGPGVPGLGGRMRFTGRGGICGVVIDARGERTGGAPEETERDSRPGTVTLLAGEPQVPARSEEPAPRRRTWCGTIRLRRELAIAGEVLVSRGQPLEPGTVVARSARTFLRPFFLDVAGALKVAPRDAEQYLVKRVGDTLAPGDLIAHRKVNILASKSYPSPVAGRIERILPNGTLIVRESPEEAQRLSAVSVAKDLSLHPEQIKSHLRVRVGQAVEKGQWVAAMGRPGSMRVSRAKARGKVKEINLAYGVITIEPLLEELEVLAWFPGTVTEMTERGCVVEGEGARIEGIWGSGGEVYGPLGFDTADRGTICVKEFATAEDLAALDEAGVAGLIVGGLHLKDMIDLAPAYTVVVTEGFGQKTMSPEIHALLAARSGQLALLDGTTELRVGVRRPRAILPGACLEGSQ